MTTTTTEPASGQTSAPAVAPPGDAERHARLRACTILLVDDEEANLDLLEALLGSEGYESLLRTTDPRDVPALVARHAPDLVLLDLHMPHRHGLEVLGELRALTPPGDYRPVLVLTADVTSSAKERALALGARDFLTKPFDTTEVLLRVENLLETRVLHADEQRARLRAEAAEARATLLAEWSRLLASTLDPRAALAHLPRLLVPRWAEACVALLGAGGGDDDRRTAEAFAGADAETWGPVLRERAAMDAGVPMPRATTTTGIPAVVVAAPITTGDGVVGAIVLAYARDGLVADPALVEELASRAGLAAEHARLLASAELATRDRERLLAVVAHDLRNPLGVIAMYAEMLASMQPDDGDAYTRAALGTVHASATTMQHLVEDLLDASTLHADALRVHRSGRRVGAAFEEAHRLLAPLAEAAGVELIVHAEGDAADRHGTLDHERVVQLLSNLVGNAVKFTPRGGTVAVRYAMAKDGLQASVADTGRGIDPDDMPHLFTAFWQRDRRDGRGVGLGLWIARAIVEAHGGRLRVASTPGQGTTFGFTLPFSHATPRWED